MSTKSAQHHSAEKRGPKPWWRRIILSFMLLPDEKQGWIPFGAIAGLRIIRKLKADCLYSSGPPWTTHIIALILSRLTGIPWVADFRDPWSSDDQKPEYTNSWLSDKLESWLRNSVLHRASAVICNTSQAEHELARTMPEIASKIVTITNGFDPSEVLPPNETVESNRVMIHAGSIFRQRDPKAFLQAIASMVSEGLIGTENLRIEFLGTLEIENQETLSLMNELSESGVLIQSGPVPREDCLRKMQSADALLLLDMGRPTQIPGKFFDYLQVKKPILALTEPHTPTAEAITKTHCGISVDWRNQEAIKTAILSLLDPINKDAFAPENSVIANYDVRQLTSRLADVFQQVRGEQRGG